MPLCQSGLYCIMSYFKFKEFIKYKIIRTQHEWESHIDNIFHLLDENIKTYNPNNMLDVGCGSGDRTIRIANYFNIDMQNTYGVDYDDQCIIDSRKTFNIEKIDLETDKLPYKESMFDLVICNQVLEHLKNYRKVIDDVIRVTRKEGYIVFGIPNLAHLINRIYLLFGIQPMCIYLDGPHVRGYTHKSFINLLNSLQKVRLIDYTGSTTMYPLPFVMAKFLANYFIGLSGYVCYLLQKIQ